MQKLKRIKNVVPHEVLQQTFKGFNFSLLDVARRWETRANNNSCYPGWRTRNRLSGENVRGTQPAGAQLRLRVGRYRRSVRESVWVRACNQAPASISPTAL